MKKFLVLLLVIVFISGGVKVSEASDWDVAGKILTGIEGLRILTGGRVDVVGTMIGNGKHREQADYKQHHKKRKHRRYAKHYSKCKEERIWIPHYEWHKKHIPAHEDYDEYLGTIYVEEHYIKYKVQNGGHWEHSRSCH